MIVTHKAFNLYEIEVDESQFTVRKPSNITIDKEGILHFAQDRTDDISVNLYIMTLA